MTVVITMAGAGSRFSKMGYSLPKYQIEANGASLLHWSLKSLSKFKDQQFIFACLSDVDITWLNEEISKSDISDFEIKLRDTISAGQAQTAYDAIKELSIPQKKEPLWIFNIDTYVHDGMAPEHLSSADGVIYVYHANSPSMSYLQHDKDEIVTRVAEKKRISSLASVGMYGFKSLELFEYLYRQSYCENRISRVGGEQYIMPIYSIALERNMIIRSRTLQNSDVTVLGTPEELLKFDDTATAFTG